MPEKDWVSLGEHLEFLPDQVSTLLINTYILINKYMYINSIWGQRNAAYMWYMSYIVRYILHIKEIVQKQALDILRRNLKYKSQKTKLHKSSRGRPIPPIILVKLLYTGIKLKHFLDNLLYWELKYQKKILVIHVQKLNESLSLVHVTDCTQISKLNIY